MVAFSSLLKGVSFLAAVSAAVVVETQTLSKRDECAGGPWAPVLVVGGSKGGAQACETHWGGNYSPIVGIEIWQDPTGINPICGLQFTYATGETSQIYGHEDATIAPQTFKLAAGDTFKNVIIYGDGNGRFLGHIHIETTGGGTFDGGMDLSKHKLNAQDIQTGGGILYGATITPDSTNNPDVVNLGLLFLNQPVDHIEVGNVQYDASANNSAANLNPNSIFTAEWYNNADGNQTYTDAQTFSVTQAYSFSQSTTNTFSISDSIEFGASFFDLIDVKDTVSYQWQYASETASTTASSTSTALTCGTTGTLAPQKGIKVSGSFANGNGTFDYSSTVTVHLKDGNTFSYPEKGQLTNVAYTQCQVSTNDDNDASIQNTNPLSSAGGSSGSSTITSAPSTSTGSSKSSKSSKKIRGVVVPAHIDTDPKIH